MNESERCWTCGRKRGLAPIRRSWSLGELPLVPRTGSPEDKPAQITNDLICNAVVYRNGGTNEDTHLCDECLRIGVRSIKVGLDKLLDELDDGKDKDAELVKLTQRLGTTQHQLSNLQHDHDRMQGRLRAVLEILDSHKIEETEAIKFARWEAERK